MVIIYMIGVKATYRSINPILHEFIKAFTKNTKLLRCI